jgi:hypothetical protein
MPGQDDGTFDQVFSDYRDQGVRENRAEVPKTGVRPQFVKGPTWVGLQPPDYILDTAKQQGKDPNEIIPPANRDLRPKSAYDKWNEAHPDPADQLTPRQQCILATYAKMVGDAESLDAEGQHYPRVGLLKTMLRERGSLHEDEIGKLDVDARDYLFKLFLRVNSGDKTWAQTVAGMKKAK